MAQAQRPPFAHESEAELARILDFYGVRWEYEPHTFPILWNLEGDVLESFSPDFFLPELDLYVELTTLKQRLVRKKNRKLRRLRELYPDVRIKLFYARDFRQLMLKYGKLALADELSGTTGQVPLPYGTAVDQAPTGAERPDAAAATLPSLPSPDDEPTDASPVDDASVRIAEATPEAVAEASAPIHRSARSHRRPRRDRRAARRGATTPAGAMMGAGDETAE